jgi:hypothetical protein
MLRRSPGELLACVIFAFASSTGAAATKGDHASDREAALRMTPALYAEYVRRFVCHWAGELSKLPPPVR